MREPLVKEYAPKASLCLSVFASNNCDDGVWRFFMLKIPTIPHALISVPRQHCVPSSNLLRQQKTFGMVVMALVPRRPRM